MTKIQWCTETWNPLVGCSKISAGCSQCYAAEAAKSARLQQFPQYQKVKDWDGTMRYAPASYEFVENQLLKPLSWKSPKKVFVCSMSDIFHPRAENEWLNKIFAVMAMTPQHTFQILTKRPERMKEYLTDPKTVQRIGTWIAADLKPHYGLVGLNHSVFDKFRLPLPNVWLGTSTENQTTADSRIPSLLQTPASVRFLSCEPLLESIDLNKCFRTSKDGYELTWLDYLNLIIVGGESGSGARPCHIDWIRSLVQQCQPTNVSVFVKQLGSNPIIAACYIDGVAATHQKLKLADRKGGDINEFPEDLRVREFPA